MMGEPLVSIVVPVYNAERTLERCLRSIQNQSYQNIEILIVNDGSTDHTGRIIEKYTAKDPRFCCIEKENSGVSDSRNLAIKAASGKYLQFMDSDDWLIKCATEEYVKAMQSYGCGMVVSDYYRVVGRKIRAKGEIDGNRLLTRDEFAGYMMKAPANFYYGVLWNKFYRMDIVRKQGLFCDMELDWCEDFRFNLEYLQYTADIGVIDKPLYYYVKRKGSLVDTQAGRFSLIVKTKNKLFDYYRELYKSLDLYEKNRLRIQMFYLSFAHGRTKERKAI